MNQFQHSSKQSSAYSLISITLLCTQLYRNNTFHYIFFTFYLPFPFKICYTDFAANIFVQKQKRAQSIVMKIASSKFKQ